MFPVSGLVSPFMRQASTRAVLRSERIGEIGLSAFSPHRKAGIGHRPRLAWLAGNTQKCRKRQVTCHFLSSTIENSGIGRSARRLYGCWIL